MTAEETQQIHDAAISQPMLREQIAGIILTQDLEEIEVLVPYSLLDPKLLHIQVAHFA